MRDVVVAGPGEVFDVELDADLMRENERLARENADLLERHDVNAIDIMGSIGSGKTSLLGQMVRRLKKKCRIAVLEGDLTTTIDSDLIAKHGVKTVQINTGKECHLDANLVKKALMKIDLAAVDLLFIENVGNLICPAEFPLGSQKRIVVVSVTEGPYMVVKHPFTFSGADVVVVNKIDLARAMKVSIGKIERDIKRINSRVQIVRTNCRSGEGVAKVIEALGIEQLIGAI